jgi:thermostable 8-oxoguanine DNA glycosylase
VIDPSDVTRYNRTDAQLEEFLLFSIAVAGKTAIIVSRQLQSFLDAAEGSSPFNKVSRLIKNGQLGWALRRAKLGKYGILREAFREVLDLDLRECTVEDLEKVHGIGPKTARFFLLHSRKDIRVAALDTHILKWLRNKGYKTPKGPPTGKRYYILEKVFLEEADKLSKKPAVLDLEIWNSYSKSAKYYY